MNLVIVGLVEGFALRVATVALFWGWSVDKSVLGVDCSVLGRRAIHVTVATTAEQARNDLFEFFLEIFVHPGVEERVVHRGAHGNDMGREEDQKEIFPILDRAIVFKSEVGDVEGQPAADEDADHGN